MKLFPNGIEISDKEYLHLKDRLENPEQWILDAIIGQINHCQKEMIDRWKHKLSSDQDVKFIPNNKEEHLDLIMSRPWYKNRVERNEGAKDLSVSYIQNNNMIQNP